MAGSSVALVVTKTSGLAEILDLLEAPSDSHGFFVFSGPGESGRPWKILGKACDVFSEKVTNEVSSVG